MNPTTYVYVYVHIKLFVFSNLYIIYISSSELNFLFKLL